MVLMMSLYYAVGNHVTGNDDTSASNDLYFDLTIYQKWALRRLRYIGNGGYYIYIYIYRKWMF